MTVSAGDPLPANCELIEVHVAELKQLFNAIDPSPFRERDLDANAEEFIADWAQEASPSAALGLVVYVDRPAGLPNEPAELREAIHEFFRHRAELTRHRLRELFSRGRTSLVIGLCALAISLAIGNLMVRFFNNHLGEILQEGLLIAGWVAMWRPMEIFLYDWWPIRADAKLADRLSVMPVRISYKQDGSADAWRWDWPVAPRNARSLSTNTEKSATQRLAHDHREEAAQSHEEGEEPDTPRSDDAPRVRRRGSDRRGSADGRTRLTTRPELE
jgi:hypothetical protein